MTDPLDQLKAALQEAPAPDANVKARQIAEAEKIFAAAQGSAAGARPMSERPDGRGVWTGVRSMFANLTTRTGLGLTTGLVAVGIAAIVILPQLGPEAFGPVDAVFEQEEAALPDAAGKRAVSGSAADEAPSAEPAIAPILAAPPPPRTANQSLAREAAPMPAPAPMAMPRQREASDDMVSGLVAAEPVILAPEADTEAYANEAASSLKVTAEEPVSTFSIDADTASYAVVRSSIMGYGQLPPPDAVRVEEMVNYFPYDYPAPTADGAPFRPTVTVMSTPWNAGTELVHIALQGALPAVEDRPPLNLVFLIDTSGSMQDADKLPLLIQSFRLMLNELRPEDEVAIVTYAGSAGEVLAPTPASERSTILAALEQLQAGGSTAGQQGLQQAYAVAERMAAEGEIGRVILATDGDFNVGLSDPAALEDYIAGKRETGVYLSVLGFGRGNLDDATMQALAQNGNGTAAYIDTLNEARKVLVDQLTGALFPIANDVKVQVEFNPGIVAEYRLIGYETRALRREDFNNDAVDAGEIGAGHTVTAIYEITRVGSDAVLNDALRYQPAETVDETGEIGFLRLRYKAPGEDESRLIEAPIPDAVTEGGTEARFGVAIAGFGQLLRGSDYLGDWSWGDAVALANGAKGSDPFGYRAEAVQLMRLAEALAEN